MTQIGDVDGADEGHVDREVDLRGGPGQVDGDLRPFDRDGDLDLQVLVPRVGVVDEAVEESLGLVGPVRELLDLTPQHPVGVVHQVLARVPDSLEPVALEQLHEARGADLARHHLRLHVTDDELRRTAVVPQDLPDEVVLAPFLLDLDRVELEALGKRVRRVDDAAASGRQRAEVEMVGRRRREADELVRVEDRHDEADVGLVRRAVVGMVVDDDVARLPFQPELGEAAVDAGDVARDRSRLQRCRLRGLTELAPVRVAEDAAEVLRLADDRGVGHAGQLVAHLDRDRVERAGDHRGGDRVDARLDCAHRAPPFVRIRFPEAWASACQPGGTTVVVSRWKTTAGPASVSSSGRRLRS